MNLNRTTLLIVLGILITSITIFAQDESQPNLQSDDPIERGEYLFRFQFACIDCHMPEGDDPQTALPVGGIHFDSPIGVVYAKNLTNSVDWTPEALETAIRYGVSPDGVPYFPIMAFQLYETMSDKDMADLIAYLQSLEPTENDIPNDETNLPRELFAPQTEIDIETARPEPDMSDPLAYGTYLANVAGCMHCHGQVNALGISTPAPEGLPWGWIAPPLLPYYLEDIYAGDTEALKTAITTGVRPNGTELNPTMPWRLIAHWSDEELDAVITWILSQPEVDPDENPNAG